MAAPVATDGAPQGRGAGAFTPTQRKKLLRRFAVAGHRHDPDRIMQAVEVLLGEQLSAPERRAIRTTIGAWLNEQAISPLAIKVLKHRLLSIVWLSAAERKRLEQTLMDVVTLGAALALNKEVGR